MLPPQQQPGRYEQRRRAAQTLALAEREFLEDLVRLPTISARGARSRALRAIARARTPALILFFACQHRTGKQSARGRRISNRTRENPRGAAWMMCFSRRRPPRRRTIAKSRLRAIATARRSLFRRGASRAYALVRRERDRLRHRLRGSSAAPEPRRWRFPFRRWRRSAARFPSGEEAATAPTRSTRRRFSGDRRVRAAVRAGGVEAWAASGDVAEDDKAAKSTPSTCAEYAAEHPEDDAKPSSPRLVGDEAAGEAGEDAEDAMDVDEPIAEGNTNSGDQQDAPSPDDDAESFKRGDAPRSAAAAEASPQARSPLPGAASAATLPPPRRAAATMAPARRASRRRAGARSARESRPARLGISQWAAALLCFGARSRSGSSAPWRTSRATAGA